MLKGFENFLKMIPFLDPSSRLIVLDEIGKMECPSGEFKKELRAILDSDKCLLATIALKGMGLIEEVEQREDVKLLAISERNRDDLLEEILKEVTQSLSLTRRPSST